MSPLKKAILALIVFATAGVAIYALYYTPGSAPIVPMQTENKTITLSIGTTTIVAEVADTDALRAQGLSNRTNLPDGQGMWFVFETDGLWSFWMKDTLIPLDMLWVDASGIIVTIAHEVQPDSYPQGFAPAQPARYVLEVPGGFAEKMGITEGVTVRQK